MHESPYHGLNFCQGTIAEMLDDPAREIFDVIRWFGERGKIFNVHFRNIKGRKLDFVEAFPDEGDMDMPRLLASYRDVGYPYMLMPDHVPQIDGRDPSGVAFAYCYGYIQALLDALVPRPSPLPTPADRSHLYSRLTVLGPDAQSLLGSEAYTSSPALLASKAEIRHCPNVARLRTQKTAEPVAVLRHERPPARACGSWPPSRLARKNRQPCRRPPRPCGRG